MLNSFYSFRLSEDQRRRLKSLPTHFRSRFIRNMVTFGLNLIERDEAILLRLLEGNYDGIMVHAKPAGKDSHSTRTSDEPFLEEGEEDFD